MADLNQVTAELKASRADQKTIGQMVSDSLSSLGNDFKQLKSALKKGQKDDKKANDDQKRRDAAKSEKDREFGAAFLNSIAKLGESIESAFDNIGNVASPAGLGKILFGIVGLLAATLSGFVTGFKETFGLFFKIFEKVFPKTAKTLKNLWNKIFGKGGTFRNFLAFTKKSIRRVKKFLTPIISFVKKALEPFFRILTKLSPTLKALSGGGGLMKFFKPLVSMFKGVFKVGGILGKIVGKIFLPFQIIAGLFKGLMSSIDKFKEGDILGGIGAFFGGILDVFTLGIIDVDKFTVFFKDLFGGFFDGFAKLFEGDIMGGIKDIGGSILTFVVGLPELLFDGILNAIASIFEFFGLDSIGELFRSLADVDILSTIKDVFNTLFETLSPVLDVIMSIMGTLFGAIGDAFSWIFDNVLLPVIEPLMDLMGTLFGAIGDAFAWIYENIFLPIIQPLSDVLRSIFEPIGEILTWTYNNIIRPVLSGIMYFFELIGYAFSHIQRAGLLVLNGLILLIQKLPDFLKPDALAGLELLEVPESPEFPAFEMLPELRHGGLVKGMNDGLGKLFRMGEGGDELVTPLDQIKPNILDPIMSKAMAMVPQMQQMAGGAAAAAGSALIVNAPNNSQMVNAPTTMVGSMTTRNADMSRRDMNS